MANSPRDPRDTVSDCPEVPEEWDEERCPLCGSPDRSYRRLVDTGKPRKPVCQDDWHDASTR